MEHNTNIRQHETLFQYQIETILQQIYEQDAL